MENALGRTKRATNSTKTNGSRFEICFSIMRLLAWRMQP